MRQLMPIDSLSIRSMSRWAVGRLKSGRWHTLGVCLAITAVCCHAGVTGADEFVARTVSRTSLQAAREAPSAIDSPFLLDLDERPMEQLTTHIGSASGRRPADLASDRMEKIDESLGSMVLDRYWGETSLHWQAPAFAHRPLYFEQVNLERFGYGPRYLRAVQPALSGAHFFATIPALPYLMTVEPPCRCVYPLGHHRPGNCVPYQWHKPEWSAPAGLMEAGTWIGLVLLIP